MYVPLQCLNKTFLYCDNLPINYTCPVLHFRSCFCGPSFSGPAFSCPDIWSVIFRSCIFMSFIFFDPPCSGPAFSVHPSALRPRAGESYFLVVTVNILFVFVADTNEYNAMCCSKVERTLQVVNLFHSYDLSVGSYVATGCVFAKFVDVIHNR